MTKRWDKDRFTRIYANEGPGRHIRKWGVVCRKCVATEWITDSSPAGLPPEATAKKFHDRGWAIGANKNHDICPECQKMTEAKPQVLKAVSPRQPTREDRRRVIDALDEYYNIKGECYVDSWSDKSLAAKLNVPQAWVAEERERMYGPDRNQAAEKRTKELQELERKFEIMENDTLKSLDEMRQQIQKLKVDSSYANAF